MPRVDTCDGFESKIRCEPVGPRNGVASLLLANAVCVGGGLSSVRLRFPRSSDPPDAAQPDRARRRKTRCEPRPSLPPPPARLPDLALTGASGNRDLDLAIRGGVDAERRPFHDPV